MTFQTGANFDTRPIEKREKDFKSHEVLASAAPVNWTEKTQSQWRKFPIFDQNGSGSCVAQTEAKELGIMRWLKDGVYVHFSATDIYQRRNTRPAAGMWATDARDIARRGVTLEVLTPSQSMTDEQMDTARVEEYKRKVGEVFAVPNYLELPIQNIDIVASTIQATGKGVMTWFYFTYPEWQTTPVVLNPDLPLRGDSTLRHSVCAVDYALINGKKHIIIEDSWGPGAGFNGQRAISEDFFNERNWYSGYLINFKFDETSLTKPRYTFTKSLKFSEVFVTDPDVVALQDILKYEGFFPLNTDSTGYYGAITAEGVKKFQKKYNIDNSTSPEGKDVGPRTIAKLNELYSV